MQLASVVCLNSFFFPSFCRGRGAICLKGTCKEREGKSLCLFSSFVPLCLRKNCFGLPFALEISGL